MKSYREMLEKEMKNEEFKKEWEALDEEFRLIRQRLEAKPSDYVPRKRYTGSQRENMTAAVGYAL